MKKILIILLTLGLSMSCNLFEPNNSIDFIITNNTEFLVSNLEVSLTGDLNIKSSLYEIESNSYKKIKFGMSAAKSEGAYILKYNLDNQVFEHQIGYYTNGTPLEDNLTIIIEKTGI